MLMVFLWKERRRQETTTWIRMTKARHQVMVTNRMEMKNRIQL